MASPADRHAAPAASLASLLRLLAVLADIAANGPRAVDGSGETGEGEFVGSNDLVPADSRADTTQRSNVE